jgi:hypothetical protein
LMRTPLSVANAYRLGLFSCLSFAKARVLIASKKIMHAIQVIYSGFASRFAHSAMFVLKISSNAVRIMDVVIRDTESVL